VEVDGEHVLVVLDAGAHGERLVAKVPDAKGEDESNVSTIIKDKFSNHLQFRVRFRVHDFIFKVARHLICDNIFWETSCLQDSIQIEHGIVGEIVRVKKCVHVKTCVHVTMCKCCKCFRKKFDLCVGPMMMLLPDDTFRGTKTQPR
jgi:hypothetical protein